MTGDTAIGWIIIGEIVMEEDVLGDPVMILSSGDPGSNLAVKVLQLF